MIIYVILFFLFVEWLVGYLPMSALVLTEETGCGRSAGTSQPFEIFDPFWELVREVR